ncbi:Hsp20/alpha crystallin family protein [Candidatus Fermentibacterales bacterium]|nr:Hsp20/alpha crystallin family protein [Candidatus Fermentibacterales bacterium]
MIRYLKRPGWPSDSWPWIRAMQGELGRLMDGLAPSEAYPPVNVWSNGDEVLVTAEIPGVDPEHLDISIQSGSLTLKGERSCPEHSSPDCVCHRRESEAACFARSISLPYEVEADRARATCADGVLELHLPRAEQSRPRRIAVESS